MWLLWFVGVSVILLAFQPTNNLFAAGQTLNPTVTPTLFPSPSLYPTLNPSQANWKETKLPFKLTDPGNGKRIATSYSGQYVGITTPYGIYVSIDYGQTFQWAKQNSNYDDLSMTVEWFSIVSDSTGLYMHALNNKGVIWSTNGNLDNSWYPFPSTLGYIYMDIASDNSGQYIYAISDNSVDSTLCNVIQYFSGTYSFSTTFSFDNCNKVFVDSTNINLLVIGANANQIALSTNSGLTFNLYTLTYSVDTHFAFISMSYTNFNNYVYIAVNGGGVEVSNNFGQDWISPITTFNTDFGNSTMIASSGTGQYVVFGGATQSGSTNAEIWMSSDYGATFTSAFPTSGKIITAGTASSSGSSIYVISDDYLYCYQQAYESPMPSHKPTSNPTVHSWKTTTITENTGFSYTAIALNNNASCVTIGASDGKTLFARQSVNGPFTQWTSPEPSNNGFTSISMSIEGQMQLALNLNTSIFLSNNSGRSWTRTSDHGVLEYNSLGWKYSAMSDNGLVIFLSQDAGVFAVYNGQHQSNPWWEPTFQIVSPLDIVVAGIAMTSDGSTWAVAATSGFIYISLNYGQYWYSQGYALYSPRVFAASRSTNLQNMYLGMRDRNIWSLSSDQGYEWDGLVGPGNPTNIWASMSCSYNGLYAVAGIQAGKYDSSTAQDGVYYYHISSSTSIAHWTMQLALEKPVTAINPDGGYIVAVSSGTPSTEMHYYTQSVPTAAPTRYAPSAHPSLSNAPYYPITKNITGWVTRSQYEASYSTCSNAPVTVTAYYTGACLPTGKTSSVQSVKYICDSETILMYEYGDTMCREQLLGSPKSFDNGQEYNNDQGQCGMKLRCQSGTTPQSVLADDDYGVVEFYYDYCVTPMYFQAMLNKKCIDTPSTVKSNSGVGSAYLNFPELYEYDDTGCSGKYSSYYYEEDVCWLYTSSNGVVESEQQSMSFPNALDPTESYSIQKDAESFGRLIRQKVDQKAGLRKIISGVNVDEAVSTSYGFDDDNIYGYTHYYASLVNGKVNVDDDSISAMSAGAIAGTVIGSICGAAIIAGLFFCCYYEYVDTRSHLKPAATDGTTTGPDGTVIRESTSNAVGGENANQTTATAQPAVQLNTYSVAATITTTTTNAPIAAPMVAPGNVQGGGVMYTMGPSGNLVPMNNGGNVVYVMNPGTNTMTPMMMPMNAAPMGQQVVYNTAVNPMYANTNMVPAGQMAYVVQQPQRQ